MRDSKPEFNCAWLADKGLNLQAAFNLSDLAEDVLSDLVNHCDDLASYKQLLLIGHGGRGLWEGVQQTDGRSDHPVDDYSVQTITWFLEQEYPGMSCTFLYPGTATIGLRALGALAGWHHATPFRVGIHPQWGTWFAYRAVVLANTSFRSTQADNQPSPCDGCLSKPCIPVCPAKALETEDLELDRCFDFRLQDNSICADKCLSRLACPVGIQQKYTKDQMAYHYGRSLKVIRALDRGTLGER